MGYNSAKLYMENSKNNETQNRRQFFKEAAKKTLPILGLVALMSNPMIAKAVEKDVTNCNEGCYTSCSGTCSGNCKESCRKGCKGNCVGSCKNRCDFSCKGECMRSSKK